MTTAQRNKLSTNRGFIVKITALYDFCTELLSVLFTSKNHLLCVVVVDIAYGRIVIASLGVI